MKISILIPMLFGIAFSTGYATSTDSITVFRHTEILDEKSKATLGVHIRALCLLLIIDEREGEIFKKDSARRDGTLLQLIELEKHGYIRLAATSAPPDGSSLHSDALLARLTDKGRGVVSVLKRTL